MDNIKIGDTIEVKVRKITVGNDGKLYVTIEGEYFVNKPSLVIKDKSFFWQSNDESVYLKKV